MASYIGYCVKCKCKREFEGEVRGTENGRRMAQGFCPVCHTKISLLVKGRV